MMSFKARNSDASLSWNSCSSSFRDKESTYW